METVLRHRLQPGDEELFKRMELRMRAEAIEARKKAEHYGNPPFQVGSSVLVRRKDGSIKTYRGANFKPGRHEVQKVCAEFVAITAAKMELEAGGFDYAIGIVLYGPQKRDDVSNRPTNTLHPCEICRPWLSSLDGIGHDFRITSFAANGEEIVERLTLREVLQLHAVHFQD